eukprot:8078437-Alexandrium_andersonii.AAC.1
MLGRAGGGAACKQIRLATCKRPSRQHSAQQPRTSSNSHAGFEALTSLSVGELRGTTLHMHTHALVCGYLGVSFSNTRTWVGAERRAVRMCSFAMP